MTTPKKTVKQPNIDNIVILSSKKNIFKITVKGAANENKILFSEHHLSHAASAFYPSPFEEALILTLDGVGEWATTTVSIGKGNKINIVKEIHFPHSLGLLYSAFTYFLISEGFLLILVGLIAS